MHRIYKSCW